MPCRRCFINFLKATFSFPVLPSSLVCMITTTGQGCSSRQSAGKLLWSNIWDIPLRHHAGNCGTFGASFPWGLSCDLTRGQ